MYDTYDDCRWWENKGDVWRLLQDMAVTIDGRTFPAKDEAQVFLLHHTELVAGSCRTPGGGPLVQLVVCLWTFAAAM